MNNYQKSKFNIIVPYKDNENIIFNSFSGAIGKMDNETLNRFNNDNLEESEINTLLKKGILINCDFDELAKVNNDREKGINNNKVKYFRIWPTSACNARCYYCFEKGIKAKHMSLETADKVINFISKFIEEDSTLKIEWFGGEPLLCVDTIDYISKKLVELCNAKNCKYKSTMITNGSLINAEIAQKMKNAWNLSLVQITLDGYGKDYDNIKNYYNKSLFNFDSVIENIKTIAENTDIHVTIRMNYDTHNYDSLYKLINYICENLKQYKNISCYVYPVWSSIEENVDGQFISNTEIDKNLLSLFDLLIKNKMGDVRKIARINYRPNACQAWSLNSYTILPDGKMSKCCESYHQIVGDVSNGITNQELFNFWVNPKLDEKCENCKLVPICQGGCKASKFSKMPQCIMLKPHFDDFLKWYVSYLDEELEEKNKSKTEE